MAGRVVTVASPLPIVLDGMPGGTEQVFELERSVDLVGVTAATLQVAVRKCSVATSGVAGFSVEVRPIEIDPGSSRDTLGDPVATVVIDDSATGKLLLAPFSAGFGSAVQVTVRGGQPTTGPLSLVAHVSVACKWREERHVAIRRAARKLAAVRRRGQIVRLATLLDDDELLPLASSLRSVANLRGRIASARRATSAVPSRGECRSPDAHGCPSRPAGALDRSEGAAPEGDRLKYPTEIEVVAVSRGPHRVVRGPFRTRGRCVPTADRDVVEGRTAGSTGVSETSACRCGLRHAPASTASLATSNFDLAVAESCGVMAPTPDGAPLRRAAVFLDNATPWVGGLVSLPSVGAALEVVPVALEGMGPGTYDLELSLVTGGCRGTVRAGGFIVLEPLTEANTSNVVGPISLDGLVHPTNYPFEQDVEIRGRLYLPAAGGTIRPGPIVIVGHGVVDNCLPDPELTNAVLAVGPLLERLAANGFVAAAVEGVADSAAALAALGLLRWLQLPIDHPLELGQLPAERALVGHSQAATVFPAVASYINGVAQSDDPYSADPWLNLYVATEVDDGLELPDLDVVQLPVARAVTVVSFAPPVTPINDLQDTDLQADFNYWLVISGTHDGDVVGANALEVFDRLGSGAPARPPGIQASVRVRRLDHGSWFDRTPLEDGHTVLGQCDPNALPEVPSLTAPEGNSLNQRLVPMWLLGVMERSRHRSFFEIRNLIALADDDVLRHAEEVQWRVTFLPWRFFDPTTDAWFVETHGVDPREYIASDVSAEQGVLSELAAPDEATYRVGHVRTAGVLLAWGGDGGTPTVEFPAQFPDQLPLLQPGGLALQITGGVPPDGVPDPTLELTFRVAVKVSGIRYWLDLADYGGWRVPEIVLARELSGQQDTPYTTVVLSTISIPISDFGQQVAGAVEVEAVEFDLAAAHASGRFYLASVAITGWKGETFP